jgi:hypothetical protein
VSDQPKPAHERTLLVIEQCQCGVEGCRSKITLGIVNPLLREVEIEGESLTCCYSKLTIGEALPPIADMLRRMGFEALLLGTENFVAFERMDEIGAFLGLEEPRQARRRSRMPRKKKRNNGEGA